MKKFASIAAALVAVGIALPSIASAETLVVRHGDGDRDRGARAEMRDHDHDRGWRDHGWRHHDKVVVIRHRHHDHD